MASNASIPLSFKKLMMLDNKRGKTAVNLAHFPDDVIDTIFSFLPLKEAITYGLTSKRFITSWKFSRDLSFDIDYRTLADPSDIFKIIQFVMDEHRGPLIQRLLIIVDPSGKENQIHDWIQKAVAKGVSELNLNFSAGDVPFVFPSGILNGARLHVLKVCHCDLDSLKQFDSLRYLKAITIEDVDVPRYFPDAIFANCLSLESFEINNCNSALLLMIEAEALKNFKSLKVVHFNYLRQMYVNAPNLEVFHYIGDICRIVLKHEMPKLEEAVFHFSPSRSINLFPGVESLMRAFRCIKVLSISSSILERLCPKFVTDTYSYKEFYFCLEKLKEIRLCLGGSRDAALDSTNLNPYDIARFLSKSPSIEKLTLNFGTFPLLAAGPYWELVVKPQFQNFVTCFKFLKSICLINFKFHDLEMQLAKFIIKSAKGLEHIVIGKARRYLGTKENEMDFVRSLNAEKFQTTVYEYKKYKSY